MAYKTIYAVHFQFISRISSLKTHLPAPEWTGKAQRDTDVRAPASARARVFMLSLSQGYDWGEAGAEAIGLASLAGLTSDFLMSMPPLK